MAALPSSWKWISAPPRRLGQRISHGAAELGRWQHGGEAGVAVGRGRSDQPADLLHRRDPQRPDARAGLRGIVGEGQHRNAGGGRGSGHRRGLGGGERTDDHARAARDGRLRRRRRAGRRATGVLHVQRRRAGLRQRELRGLDQRVAAFCVGPGQRRQQRHPAPGRGGGRQPGLSRRERARRDEGARAIRRRHASRERQRQC